VFPATLTVNSLGGLPGILAVDTPGHWAAFEPSPARLSVTSSLLAVLSQLSHTSQYTLLLLHSGSSSYLSHSTQHPKSWGVVHVQDIQLQVELFSDLGDEVLSLLRVSLQGQFY
jgi:hypothetical protein